MLIKAPSPKGIDYKLQKYQTDLHTFLINRWGLTSGLATDYLCYDRCYRNQNKNGFIPEVYNQNGSYSDVAFNDKVKVLSFFGLGNTIEHNMRNHANNAKVHLIYCVNLKKLKGGVTRPDEETRQDVQYFTTLKKYGFNLESIDIGIDQVFLEYTGLRVNYRDLQPFHCFRFNFNVLYSYDDHECT